MIATVKRICVSDRPLGRTRREVAQCTQHSRRPLSHPGTAQFTRWPPGNSTGDPHCCHLLYWISTRGAWNANADPLQSPTDPQSTCLSLTAPTSGNGLLLMNAIRHNRQISLTKLHVYLLGGVVAGVKMGLGFIVKNNAENLLNLKIILHRILQ